MRGNMTATYRAIALSGPGQFSEVIKPVLDPGLNQVRIRVVACGVCHSDSGTVEALFPIDWPRVPGHDVVGRIDALGPDVRGWALGQRVGVGLLAGSCGLLRVLPKRRSGWSTAGIRNLQVSITMAGMPK